MPRRRSTQIAQSDLIARFRYEDGALFWLPRGNGRFDKQFAGRRAGCFSKTADAVFIGYKGTNILLHRAVWIYHNGEIPDGVEIDHINQNRRDNRIENLRLCVRAQNAWNTGLRTDNKSGVKGVCWNPLTNTWRARVRVNKVEVAVGSFKSLDEAEAAVSKARAELHGVFANMGHSAQEGASCR
jgi:hypothetical protein